MIIVDPDKISKKELGKLLRKATRENPVKFGNCTYHGPLPDDDPLYTNAGWNFLVGKNLNPPRT
jgi:hypothetical protein